MDDDFEGTGLNTEYWLPICHSGAVVKDNSSYKIRTVY